MLVYHRVYYQEKMPPTITPANQKPNRKNHQLFFDTDEEIDKKNRREAVFILWGEWGLLRTIFFPESITNIGKKQIAYIRVIFAGIFDF